ncbi:hypothetical protein ACLQ2R_17465 [Streptosporangium sp. DT93]|uniref:hypothetical protein n=1 Tax=Streptosporangium sp. DT93 TaxID=3393428 RepID=UPI003CE7E88C
MTPNRLPGHTLSSEGAAFAWTTNGGRYVRTTGRRGVALCSCGETSSTLDSNSARKRWHREHKDELRRGPATAQGNTADSVKSTSPAGPTLVIAHTTAAGTVDVAWIEDAVLVRLKPGAQLAVRLNPREDVPAHRPPHPPGTAEEPDLVERIAAAIERLCPEPGTEHFGDHCPYREAADTARKVGADRG